mgnify:CR=1 FL=1
MQERINSIYVRVTEKEKQRIKNKADKCGLTISEYLRKRALGYFPKALLPESFYELQASSVIYMNSLIRVTVPNLKKEFYP